MSSSTSSSEPGRVRPGWAWVLGFLLVNAVVLFASGVVLERLALRFDYNVEKWREVMTMEGADYDIVVHGNSVTMQSWDPTVVDEVTGRSSYNLASGGQGWVSGELVLSHWLEQNEAPDWVVLGVFINRPDDGTSLAPEIWDYLSSDARRLYRRRVAEAGGGRLWSWQAFNAVPAFRYRRVIDEVVKYVRAGESRTGFLRRGFLGTRYHPPSPVVAAGEVDGSVDIEALSRVIDVAEASGARVLLYEPPNHPGRSERNPNREETLSAVQALVASRDTVVAFRSFVDGSALEWTEWSGEDHLNVAGAERFGIEQLGPWVRDVVNDAP